MLTGEKDSAKGKMLLERCCSSEENKSPGRQAKPQSLAVWWLLKQLTAPGPRPRSSTNDLAPLLRMGWIFHGLTETRWSSSRKEPRCRGFATAGAEDGRPASIAASRGGGAEAIVACLGGILA